MAGFDPRDNSNRHNLSVREIAERFIELFHHQDNPEDAFMTWVHPDYIQHNPNAPTGRDATLGMMRTTMAANPDLTHDVKRVIYGEEKDGEGLVAVHHHFRRTKDERGYAVVDILRIKDGYVVEHWDVLQEVPDPSTTKNDNSMF
ncbi:nuclear transport factor 2 family protein [Croceibacterium sp. LX-88]|uniref:Nuclear transport factor 2 family protein n=1 Tax=Croceibacterium selenioxidans TaxID=2838833 RepID=A0ABS5W4U9_9SPHN|nr:nuclear transport factor 2 family protein [Croceibacterium selenioxidans]MBT2134777.1 nuclear transport factor 2 family protein [Croceibacterium selenioxidans]